MEQEKKPKTSQDQQLQYISDVTYLEEARNIQLIFKGIITVSVLLLILFIWSAFVKIEETTKSFGQLIPKGEVQLVQHLEGGIVKSVVVNEGELVHRNQLLVLLDTAELEAQLNELRSNEVTLILEVARLNAFLNKKPADPLVWGKLVINSKYNPIEQQSQIATLVRDQVALLEAKNIQIASIKAGLHDALEQRKEELNEFFNKKKIWTTHMQLLAEEFAMYQKLKNKEYISGRDYLTLMREINTAKGEGANIDSKIAQTRQAISEAENKIKEVESTSKEESLTVLAKDQAQLLEIRHKIDKAVKQIQRSSIKAPITGTIKDITVFAGNVVKPASTLLEIVPQGEQLIGETKILPREIGYITTGAPVQIKVLTYDYSRFGVITGKVTEISASTFIDPEGNPYYKTKISLDQQYIAINGDKKYLKAGMTIEADIITGSKTLLDYLLKPIHRALSESFRER